MTEDTLLDDELQVIREQTAQRMPAEIVETMEKAIEEVEAMTIGRGLDVGAQAPDFAVGRIPPGIAVADAVAE